MFIYCPQRQEIKTSFFSIIDHLVLFTYQRLTLPLIAQNHLYEPDVLRDEGYYSVSAFSLIFLFCVCFFFGLFTAWISGQEVEDVRTPGLTRCV